MAGKRRNNRDHDDRGRKADAFDQQSKHDDRQQNKNLRPEQAAFDRWTLECKCAHRQEGANQNQAPA